MKFIGLGMFMLIVSMFCGLSLSCISRWCISVWIRVKIMLGFLWMLIGLVWCVSILRLVLSMVMFIFVVFRFMFSSMLRL